MDSTLIEIFGKSCALMVYNATKTNGTEATSHDLFRCVTHGTLQDSAFGDAYVISLGFIVVLCITIPVAFFNLDQNIWVQVWFS